MPEYISLVRLSSQNGIFWKMRACPKIKYLLYNKNNVEDFDHVGIVSITLDRVHHECGKKGNKIFESYIYPRAGFFKHFFA